MKRMHCQKRHVLWFVARVSLEVCRDNSEENDFYSEFMFSISLNFFSLTQPRLLIIWLYRDLVVKSCFWNKIGSFLNIHNTNSIPSNSNENIFLLFFMMKNWHGNVISFKWFGWCI